MTSNYLVIKNLIDILDLMKDKIRMVKVAKILQSLKMRHVQYISNKITRYIGRLKPGLHAVYTDEKVRVANLESRAFVDVHESMHLLCGLIQGFDNKKEAIIITDVLRQTEFRRHLGLIEKKT